MIDPKDLQARSDQMNAVDLVDSVIFRIEKVDYFPRKPEQCIHLHLEGCEGRPYKPCKGMLRGLVKAWGMDQTIWSGRLIEIFCESSVKWGGEETGGIEISGVSHIAKPVSFTKVLNRSKRVIHTFKVLPDTQEVKEEFILTHHIDAIEQAESDAAITEIAVSVKRKFGADALDQIKDAVIEARKKFAPPESQQQPPADQQGE